MTFEMLRDLPKIPIVILRALILDREERAELDRIHASSRRWPEQLAPVVQLRAADDPERIAAWSDGPGASVQLVGVELELVHARAELAEIRAKLADVHDAAQYDDITTVRAVEMLAEQRDSVIATGERCHNRHIKAEDDLAQCTRERDAARKAITGVSAPLLERTVALGKANAEIEQLLADLGQCIRERDEARADVVRITTAHDALDDAALASAEKIKRLRQDLTRARNQLPATPAIGDTVTLRLESGDHLIGPLYRDAVGRRVVHGWFVDRDGRSLVPAPGGGGDRG